MQLRPLTLALVLGLGSALAGCDLAPHYVRPAPPVPAVLPSGAAYAPATPGATAPADIAWRDFFVDARLRGLIELALADNRDLRVALANVAQARAQARLSHADLFPTIAGNAGATYEKESLAQYATTGTTTGAGTGAATASIPRRFDIYQANVGISSYEIDLFGRLRNQSKEAFENYLSSQEARNAAQVTLISEVATAYLTLAADQDQLQIASDTARSDADTLSLTRSRFTIGVASELDVRQAQSSYETARGQTAKATTQVAQDVNALALLVGAPVPAEFMPNGLASADASSGDATIASLPVGLASDVLLRRPDIAEAEHKLRAANADIGAARAAFFPQISLTAAVGTLSLGLSGLFSSGNGTWSVEPSATLPIFDFGKNQANLNYSKASRDAAVAQYEKAIQTGFKEVADALAQRGTITEQVAAQTALLDAASVSYRLSDARYRAGVDPFLSVLDAQRTLFNARQGLIATRLAAQSNMVELYRSLGGGLR